MAVHWTYQDISRGEDLSQGDILSPSPELLSLFAEVHPHFCRDKYLGFMVASQSCDLVRRGGIPKAGYIALSAIRPLSSILPKLVAQVATPIGKGKFLSSGLGDLKRLLERIFNQNEQAIGLFFLYPDGDLKLGEEAVAMLRVTVSVRSQHYELLTNARVGGLKAEFQAKLGWLLGNLYNRPATPDWSDHEGGKEKLKELISIYSGETESQSENFGVAWIDDELIKEAKRKKLDVENLTPDDLERLRPEPTLEKALSEIESNLCKVFPEVSPETVTKLRNRLRNSGKFTRLFSKN